MNKRIKGVHYIVPSNAEMLFFIFRLDVLILKRMSPDGSTLTLSDKFHLKVLEISRYLTYTTQTHLHYM